MTVLSGQDAEAERRLIPDVNGSVWYGRAREKQASRDEDARRLAVGEVTPEQLRVENSFFGTGPFVISHPGGRPKKKMPRR